MGRVRHRIDACVPTRELRVQKGHFGYYADFVHRHRRVGATIREGVEDRGLGLGTIREQRGRGNVTETTDCGAYVASAWADIHLRSDGAGHSAVTTRVLVSRAGVKEASLVKGVQAVCNPWDIAWRQGGSRGKRLVRKGLAIHCYFVPHCRARVHVGPNATPP